MNEYPDTDPRNGDLQTPPALAHRLHLAEQQLASITETPRLDAEILLAHALGLSRAALLARLRDRIPVSGFDDLLARRLNCEPIAYILGVWEFFSIEFRVRPPILVPRPETEHLVEVALEYLNERPGAARVLDLGTGTGCVALAIARNAPRCTVYATDINSAALELARENAKTFEIPLELRHGDLFAALEADTAPFDAIVSNPPYVEEGDWPKLSPVIRRHEDPRALLAGPDGLDVIRRIIAGAPAFLRPGGLLAFEIGERHRDPVGTLLEPAGYHEIGFRNDLSGIPRVAFACRG